MLSPSGASGVEVIAFLEGLAALMEHLEFHFLSLTSENFYKSMTMHTDHRISKDVYRGKTPSGQEVS